MVGGAPVSRALADEIGADGFADDCVLAVEEADRLLGHAAGAARRGAQTGGHGGTPAGPSTNAGGAR
jgi:hypothetical protein